MTQISIQNDREYAQFLKNGSGRSGIKSIYIVDLNEPEEYLDNCIGDFEDLEKLGIADCRCFRKIPKSIGKLTKVK